MPTVGCPARPINVPIYLGQGPTARALTKEIADGRISLGGTAEGLQTCLVSTQGTVLEYGEDVTSPQASTALKPIIALAYHHRYLTGPESVKELSNGEASLSVERVDENVRHLSVHHAHNIGDSNDHAPLVERPTPNRCPSAAHARGIGELCEHHAQLEARAATKNVFGRSGCDVERELRVYAKVAGFN